jgi:hypothetical protein
MIKVTEEAIENFKLNILRVIEQGYQSGVPSAYMNQRIEEIIIENPFLFVSAENSAFAIMQTLGISQEQAEVIYPVIMSLFVTTYSLMNIQHDLDMIRG